MKPSHVSILDISLDRLLLMAAVWKNFPGKTACYKFNNSGTEYDRMFLNRFKKYLENYNRVDLKFDELETLEGFGIFSAAFLDHLKDFKLSTNDILASIGPHKNLNLYISGEWQNIVLWPDLLDHYFLNEDLTENQSVKTDLCEESYTNRINLSTVLKIPLKGKEHYEWDYIHSFLYPKDTATEQRSNWMAAFKGGPKEIVLNSKKSADELKKEVSPLQKSRFELYNIGGKIIG